MRTTRHVAAASVLALLIVVGGSPTADAHPDNSPCPATGLFFHHCGFFSVGTNPGSGQDRVALFKNAASTGDLTALFDLETGGPSSHRWRTGVSGPGNGLSLLQGTYYLEKQGLGVPLRIQPASTPNIIVGSLGNIVTSGAVGATISGGGGAGSNGHLVTDNFGTVGGGQRNVAGLPGANANDATFATVGGGIVNNARATVSTVGGGTTNTATGYASTVAGGSTNNAGGFQATIGGGGLNLAGGQQSTVAGGVGNFATFIGSVGGGASNNASGVGSTVAGGQFNLSTEDYATIAGGLENLAGNGPESTTDSPYAFVGGGQQNEASASHSVIAGGFGNAASAFRSSIGGGTQNFATDDHGTVAGGNGNRAGDGDDLPGNHPYASVGGGTANIASGSYTTVPGGLNNTAAGTYGFAAGRRAKANNQGTFVWADSKNFDFTSQSPDEFSARATGGVRFVSGVDGVGAPTTGVTLAPGGGSWSSLSDRSAKTAIKDVSPQTILRALSELSVSTWSYKGQKGVRHIGPMAQDFYTAFGVGEDARHITTVDADGVLMAAMQALLARIQVLEQEVGDRN